MRTITNTMRNFATRAGLVASACLHAACAQVPYLVPHVAHVEIADQVNQANLIVVGLVENEQVVRTVSGTKEDGPLQLLAVNIRVEGTLEGQFNEQRLTFYYYQMTGGAWNGQAPNIVTPGERGIFFLVRDGGVLRATTDAYLSHTHLETGRHSISPAASEGRIQDAIAQLVLLPGEGVDLPEYLGSLHRGKALALSLLGRAQVSQILQGLLKNPNPEVRGRGCITLAEFPLNEKSCLQEVIKDVQTSSEDRKRAEELMRAASKL